MKVARIATLTALVLVAAVGAAQTPPSQSRWMVDYVGQSEYRLRMDNRLAAYLHSHLPTASLPDWGPANTAAMTFLDGVPGMLQVESHRFVVASGCPAHACVARGMLWVDTQTDTAVFVVTATEEDNDDRTTVQQYPIGAADLLLATKENITPDKLPDELRHAIVIWLHRVGVLRVSKVTLLLPNGNLPVTAEQLGWTGRSPITTWE